MNSIFLWENPYDNFIGVRTVTFGVKHKTIEKYKV